MFYLCSKIGKLTLARLLMAHDAMMHSSGNKVAHFEEVLELCSDLMKLDPSHVRYYKEEHSLVLMQQVNFHLFNIICLEKCTSFSFSIIITLHVHELFLSILMNVCIQAIPFVGLIWNQMGPVKDQHL